MAEDRDVHPWRVPPLVLGVLAACFLLSGAAGLAYEVVWTRMLILVFGATSFAISTVLTAFMTGLALGGFLGGKAVRRLRNPALAYGVLEIVIGLYALALPWLFEALPPILRVTWRLLHPSFPVFTLVRFLLAGAALIPPTLLMGATLPLLSAYFSRRKEGRGFRVGLLYALNTCGAVAGALLAGFLLLPGV
ncbi:MAG: fused MFS/spermidine synthase, partial [Planctomycetota bacterium]